MNSSIKIICPFCGKDITNNYTRSLPQEETTSCDYSFESHWHGGYIRETKIKRKFLVKCCEECYEENQKFENWSDRYVIRVYPIAILLAIIANLIRCYIKNNWSFPLIVFGSILYAIIALIITGIPVIIGHLSHKKSTSYKHEKNCNAL